MTKGQKQSALPFDDERSRPRGFVSLPATVGELHAPRAPVEVTDLSAKGCRISGSNLPARAEVWVAIEGYVPIRATVVWQKNGQIGCLFYGTPTKEKPAGAARPVYAPASPHPLRARLRTSAAEE